MGHKKRRCIFHVKNLFRLRRIRYLHTCKGAQFGVSRFVNTNIHTDSKGQCRVKAGYLLLDLQGVHVVVALGGVLLRVGLRVDQNVVFIPEKHIDHDKDDCHQ